MCNWYVFLPSLIRGLQNEALGGLIDLKGIDVKTETIELAGTSLTTAEGLASTISDTEPRFTFFKYIHSSGGDEQFPLIFIYTCPPGSKIKERMVYASTKQGFLSAVGSEIGLEISKKVGFCISWVVWGLGCADGEIYSWKHPVLLRSRP